SALMSCRSFCMALTVSLRAMISFFNSAVDASCAIAGRADNTLPNTTPNETTHIRMLIDSFLFCARANVTIARRGREGRKEEYSLAAFAFQDGVSRRTRL